MTIPTTTQFLEMTDDERDNFLATVRRDSEQRRDVPRLDAGYKHLTDMGASETEVSLQGTRSEGPGANDYRNSPLGLVERLAKLEAEIAALKARPPTRADMADGLAERLLIRGGMNADAARRQVQLDRERAEEARARRDKRLSGQDGRSDADDAGAAARAKARQERLAGRLEARAAGFYERSRAAAGLGGGR